MTSPRTVRRPPLRPLGLSVAQYACLQALHDAPGITGSELARRVFVSRQSTNVLLKGLEKRGRIHRPAEAGPRRERGTILTATATTLLKQARAAVAEVADHMAAPLTPAQRGQLAGLLTNCRDALGTPAGTES